MSQVHAIRAAHYNMIALTCPSIVKGYFDISWPATQEDVKPRDERPHLLYGKQPKFTFRVRLGLQQPVEQGRQIQFWDNRTLILKREPATRWYCDRSYNRIM